MRSPHSTPSNRPAPLTRERTLFTITSFDDEGNRLYSTLPLDGAATAARWHDDLADNPATQRITITANTIERTEQLITVDELPGPGEPTPQPELPEGAHTARRFYHFSSGPAVLRTGDEARAWLKRTTEQQQQHRTPHTVYVNVSQLQLFNVTLIERARLLTFAELTVLY
ncbi:hypothetical protein AQJ46_47930 [Streptomyces canus]|uniref:Uncharacterized protein n=1 Tax=Streptomyces canus TaxID=58343 RepID=A0A124HV54_9ACTN|nr:hypothetical protein [Streptomyces canus]KUN57291.1 hypothetical protein AQJ46_47930 [Streptomyces canus]